MNRIRDLREDRDLRQIDVANATGIDQKTLSNYETGKTNPDSFAIIALANFFNVSTDYLLGETSSNIKDKESILKALEKIEKEIKDIKRHIQIHYQSSPIIIGDRYNFAQQKPFYVTILAMQFF